MADTESVFGYLAEEMTVLLTTFRRDGTPVNLAVEGDRAFFRTWSTAGKTKRIRNNPEVEVAPSTLRGKPTGLPVRARARRLQGEDSRYASRAIARKHPVIHGRIIPVFHRLRGNATVHFELTPIEE